LACRAFEELWLQNGHSIETKAGNEKEKDKTSVNDVRLLLPECSDSQQMPGDFVNPDDNHKGH